MVKTKGTYLYILMATGRMLGKTDPFPLWKYSISFFKLFDNTEVHSTYRKETGTLYHFPKLRNMFLAAWYISPTNHVYDMLLLNRILHESFS